MTERNIEKLAEIGENNLRQQLDKHISDAQMNYLYIRKHLSVPGSSHIPTKGDLAVCLDKVKETYNQLLDLGIDVSEYSGKIKNIEDNLK